MYHNNIFNMLKCTPTPTQAFSVVQCLLGAFSRLFGRLYSFFRRWWHLRPWIGAGRCSQKVQADENDYLEDLPQ